MAKTNADGYLEHILKAEITDFNNPTCSSCNECCGISSMLTDKEFARLKKYLKTDKKGKELYKQCVNKMKKYREQRIMYFMCPFSNSNKRCAIYNLRPQICKDFHCSENLRDENYEKPEGSHYTIYDLFKNALQ